MKTLVLYTTLGCHLCEQALALIKPVLPAGYQISEVEISESDRLMALYGTRIPVFQRQDTGAEIGWPFDPEQFRHFLD